MALNECDRAMQAEPHLCQVVGLLVFGRRLLFDDTELHRLTVVSPAKRDEVKLLCGYKRVFKGFEKTRGASPLIRDRRSVVKLGNQTVVCESLRQPLKELRTGWKCCTDTR